MPREQDDRRARRRQNTEAILAKLADFYQDRQPTQDDTGILDIDLERSKRARDEQTGRLIGTGVGAFAGSAVPGLGTAGGAVLGGIVGGYGGKLWGQENFLGSGSNADLAREALPFAGVASSGLSAATTGLGLSALTPYAQMAGSIHPGVAIAMNWDQMRRAVLEPRKRYDRGREKFQENWETAKDVGQKGVDFVKTGGGLWG